MNILINPALLIALAPCVWSQTPATDTLLIDLNSQVISNPSSSPGGFTSTGGVVFFGANSGFKGRELWRSDGTSTGTVLCQEPNPNGDSLSSAIPGAMQALPNQPGKLLFAAQGPGTVGNAGYELWLADGSTGSTQLVRDIRVGGGGSFPRNMVQHGGAVYFLADDGIAGTELWRSDGTLAGTSLAVELVPGPASLWSVLAGPTFPQVLASNGSHLFTVSRDNFTQAASLWSTPGAGQPAQLLATFNNSSNSAWFGEGKHAVVNGRLIFSPPDNFNTGGLWSSTGTLSGLVALIPGSLLNWVVSDGTLAFASVSNGSGRSLYSTDGTLAGTQLLAGPGLPLREPGLTPGVIVQGKLIFAALCDQPPLGNLGTELAISDGTPAGTACLSDIIPGLASSAPYNFLSHQGQAFFFASASPSVGPEPYLTDGTAAGTVPFPDLVPGNLGISPNPFEPFQPPWLLGAAAANGTLTALNQAGLGKELCLLSPSSGGQMVDLLPSQTGSSNPAELTRVGSDVYFTASPNGGTERELYRYLPGSGQPPSLVAPALVNGLNAQSLTAFNGGLAFVGRTAPGSTTWSLFFTTGGPVIRLTTTEFRFPPSPLAVVGSELFAFGVPMGGVPQGPYEASLVRCNGSASTETLVDVLPGPAEPSSAWPPAVVGNRLLFLTNGPAGSEPAATDGTLAGTRIFDLQPGSADSFPAYFVGVGNGAFFAATSPTLGRELWYSDGTLAGTQVVIDATPGTGYSSAIELTRFGNAVAYHYVSGNQSQPMVSDGTAAGTIALLPGVFTSGSQIIAAGSKLFFQGGNTGYELFMSDGTALGTQSVTALGQKGGSVFNGPYLGLGEGQLLLAADSDAGRELWVTDGSLAGTFALADSNPGPEDSNPGSTQPTLLGGGISQVGGEILFAAFSAQSGVELHRVNFGLTGFGLATALGTGCGSAANMLSGAALPTLGQSWNIDLANTSPLAPAALFVDVGLSQLGVPGLCTLLLPNPSYLTGLVTDSLGNGSVAFSVPNVPQWIGLPFYLQALVVAPGQPLFGQFALSNALEVLFKP